MSRYLLVQLVLSRAQALRRLVQPERQRAVRASTSPTPPRGSSCKDNIPLLDCPDKDIEETYYFRWWTFRKHIKQTPDGFVITEFLPTVGWAGKHNTISCAAGHHLHEGRWLHDPKYLDDYSTFWFRKGGAVRSYSFWAADSHLGALLRHRRQRWRWTCCPTWSRTTRPGRRTTATPTACSGRSTTATAWRSPSAAAATARRSTATCTATRWPSRSIAELRRPKRPGQDVSRQGRADQAAGAGEALGRRGAVLQSPAARRKARAGRRPRAARLHAVVLQPARRRQVRRLEAAHGPEGLLRPLRPDDGRAAASQVRGLLPGPRVPVERPELAVSPRPSRSPPWPTC